MKRSVITVLLVIIFLLPFFTYPMLASKKTQTQQVVAGEDRESTEAQVKALGNSGKLITWQTVALGVIAATAGVLRFRHIRKMRESSWNEYERGKSKNN